MITWEWFNSDLQRLYKSLSKCWYQNDRVATQRVSPSATGADSTPPYLWQDLGVESGASVGRLIYS